jgi:hypothetical protein
MTIKIAELLTKKIFYFRQFNEIFLLPDLNILLKWHFGGQETEIRDLGKRINLSTLVTENKAGIGYP